jgi:hypothetical protein
VLQAATAAHHARGCARRSTLPVRAAQRRAAAARRRTEAPQWRAASRQRPEPPAFCLAAPQNAACAHSRRFTRPAQAALRLDTPLRSGCQLSSQAGHTPEDN